MCKRDSAATHVGSTCIYPREHSNMCEPMFTLKARSKSLRATRSSDGSAGSVIEPLLRTMMLKMGNDDFGDVRTVGNGIIEMRIQSGPGYRVYFIREGAEAVVSLCGGDKSSQLRDIERDKRIAREWR